MARVKSAVFAGSPPSDVAPDSPTWRRVIRTAIADLALVYDKATGQNGEIEVATHDGTAGRGARLGVPWINQILSGRDDRAGQPGIDLSYMMSKYTGTKGDGSRGDNTIIFGVPVFVPPGETDMTIQIAGRGLGTWRWSAELLLESTGASLFRSELVHATMGGSAIEVVGLSTADNGTDGAGVLCLLLISADTSEGALSSGTTPEGVIRAMSLFAGPTRMRQGSSSPIRRSGSPYPINVGATSWVPRDFDATLFADRLPLHSYLTGGATHNLHWLIEYITGHPVGGNAAYSLVDSAATNPVTSAFMAHTRTQFANEPEVAWPLLAQAFGAAMPDGFLVVDAAPPVSGLLDWYALMPMAVAASKQAGWQAAIPDFGTAASRLRACTLAMSNLPVQGALWATSFKCGGAAVTSAANFAAVGTSRFMTAKHTAIGFTPDAINAIDFRMQKSAPKLLANEMAVMGTCLYFQP